MIYITPSSWTAESQLFHDLVAIRASPAHIIKSGLITITLQRKRSAKKAFKIVSVFYWAL